MTNTPVKDAWENFVRSNAALGDDPDASELLDMRMSFFAGAYMMHSLSTDGHDANALRKESSHLVLEAVAELKKLGRATTDIPPLH